MDVVKDIRDKAEAMAAYARQAKDSELIEYATEIKVRAERRCGELLSRIQRSEGGRPSNENPSQPGTGFRTATKEAGIGVSDAYRYQKLAAMPADHFETAVATAKSTAGEVTTALQTDQASTSQPDCFVWEVEHAQTRLYSGTKAIPVSAMPTKSVLAVLSWNWHATTPSEVCE